MEKKVGLETRKIVCEKGLVKIDETGGFYAMATPQTGISLEECRVRDKIKSRCSKNITSALKRYNNT